MRKDKYSVKKIVLYKYSDTDLFLLAFQPGIQMAAIIRDVLRAYVNQLPYNLPVYLSAFKADLEQYPSAKPVQVYFDKQKDADILNFLSSVQCSRRSAFIKSLLRIAFGPQIMAVYAATEQAYQQIASFGWNTNMSIQPVVTPKAPLPPPPKPPRPAAKPSKPQPDVTPDIPIETPPAPVITPAPSVAEEQTDAAEDEIFDLFTNLL